MFVGVTDIGSGAKTTMALVAAEALGVPLNRIKLVSGDTATCPFGVGESGSRNTTHTGRAVIEAAEALQETNRGEGSAERRGHAHGQRHPESDADRPRAIDLRRAFRRGGR